MALPLSGCAKVRNYLISSAQHLQELYKMLQYTEELSASRYVIKWRDKPKVPSSLYRIQSWFISEDTFCELSSINSV